MPFRFRYQSLLEHRRHVEEKRQRELAQRLQRKSELEGMLEEAQSTIRENKHELADSLQGRVDMSQLGMFARYSVHMAGRGMHVVRHIAAAQQEVERARAKLLEATQQVKALELLRDREYEQWKKQQKKKENQRLDEIAVQSYARKREREGAHG